MLYVNSAHICEPIIISPTANSQSNVSRVPNTKPSILSRNYLICNMHIDCLEHSRVLNEEQSSDRTTIYVLYCLNRIFFV